MKNLLIVISFAVLVGCVTEAPTLQLSRATRVCVSVATDDLLYSTAVVSETAVQGVTRRIEKYLVNNLNDRGVQAGPSDTFKNGDAKLSVKVNTIETVTTTSIGAFSPIVKQQPKIKYTATLLAADGTTALNFDGEQDDESLDTLTKKIAEKVGDRVARCFR